MTTDEGNKWTPINNGLTNYSVSSLTVEDTLLFCGTSSGVFVSIDNGANWRFTDSSLGNRFVTSLAEGDSAVFAGTLTGVFATTDKGRSWMSLDSGITYPAVEMMTTRDSLLFVGRRGDGIDRYVRTSTGWYYIGKAYRGYPINAVIVDDVNLYAATQSGRIFKSADGGGIWEPADIELADAYSFCFATYDTILFTGTNLGLFFSTDRGVTWTNSNEGMKGYGIYSIIVHDGFVFAGTLSDGVWRRPLDEIMTAVPNDRRVIPFHFELHQNFPNPFNPTTTIKYDLPENALVTIKVFDVLGKEISRLVYERQRAGSHSVVFNASNLPSGVYFYRLQAGTFSNTKKLLLLK
ncbi:MAG TPA: T9SS type A sorting domain-containing protein [Candidatus Kryptonia bacterium]